MAPRCTHLKSRGSIVASYILSHTRHIHYRDDYNHLQYWHFYSVEMVYWCTLPVEFLPPKTCSKSPAKRESCVAAARAVYLREKLWNKPAITRAVITAPWHESRRDSTNHVTVKFCGEENTSSPRFKRIKPMHAYVKDLLVYGPAAFQIHFRAVMAPPATPHRRRKARRSKTHRSHRN